jgi:hypothetical protein
MDAIIVATALAHDLPVWTQDEEFAGRCRATTPVSRVFQLPWTRVQGYVWLLARERSPFDFDQFLGESLDAGGEWGSGERA